MNLGKSNQYTCPDVQTFKQVCDDLLKLGTPGHEKIELEKTTHGTWIPRTAMGEKDELDITTGEIVTSFLSANLHFCNLQKDVTHSIQKNLDSFMKAQLDSCEKTQSVYHSISIKTFDNKEIKTNLPLLEKRIPYFYNLMDDIKSLNANTLNKREDIKEFDFTDIDRVDSKSLSLLINFAHDPNSINRVRKEDLIKLCDLAEYFDFDELQKRCFLKINSLSNQEILELAKAASLKNRPKNSSVVLFFINRIADFENLTSSEILGALKQLDEPLINKILTKNLIKKRSNAFYAPLQVTKEVKRMRIILVGLIVASFGLFIFFMPFWLYIHTKRETKRYVKALEEGNLFAALNAIQSGAAFKLDPEKFSQIVTNCDPTKLEDTMKFAFAFYPTTFVSQSKRPYFDHEIEDWLIQNLELKANLPVNLMMLDAYLKGQRAENFDHLSRKLRGFLRKYDINPFLQTAF